MTDPSGSADARCNRVAARQFGVISHRQAASHLSDAAIRWRTSTGRWLRIHPRVYLVGAAPHTPEAAAMAALLACGRPAWAARRTAALHWGMNGVTAPSHVEVLVLGTSRRQIDGVNVIRALDIPPCDLVHLGALPITSPARTLIQLASVLTPDEYRIVFDDELRGRVSESVLRRRVQALAESRQGGIGLVRELLRERSAGKRFESPYERKLLDVLEEGGVPLPDTQIRLRLPSGRRIRIDAGYRVHKIALEVDSWKEHFTKLDWEADAAKRLEAMSCGWQFVPIRTFDLDARPAMVCTVVLERLASSAKLSAH